MLTVEQQCEVLNSKRCRCGRSKGDRKAFCFLCWRQLSERNQKLLYNRVGDGFGEAYQLAVETLDRLGARAPRSRDE